MPKPRRRGRPISGRRVVLQTASDPYDAVAITKIAEEEGTSVSAVVRDLVLVALARRTKAQMTRDGILNVHCWKGVMTIGDSSST